MPDHVVDVILELGAAHLELLNLLVRREVNLLLDAVNFVVQPMVFVENAAEVEPFRRRMTSRCSGNSLRIG